MTTTTTTSTTATVERPITRPAEVPGQRTVPVPDAQAPTDALLAGGTRPILGPFALWAGVVIFGIVMVSGTALSYG